MTIKVLVNGAFGKMGVISAKSLDESPDFELVGQTGREYNLIEAIKDSKAEVVVDFTHPRDVYQNALDIIEAGACPVIGTTGLKPEQVKTLQEKCAALKRGGIIAPNFSLSAVLMMKYAAEIAKYMPDVEIVEYHHDKKADSPSGTALRSADLIAAARTERDKPAQENIENVAGARGAMHKGIPIHAIRLPGFLAHEEIIFGAPGETLTLRHDSMDRGCFMPGVKIACQKVINLDTLIVGLENVL